MFFGTRSNRWGLWAIAWGWLVVAVLPGLAAEEKNPLATLKKVHPRLILNPQDVPLLKQAIENDPARREIYEKIKVDADEILNEPPVEYKLIGPRLLDKSRRCLNRMYQLSLVYLMSGDSRYLQRAVKELDAAGSFPDWNPSHFLDTAEMSHAFGIAYDWLYQGLSPEERERIRTALIEKGIGAYLNGFETGAWWTKATHNWNQVCHGGVGVGALAIADEIPDKAAEVIRKAVKTMPRALRGYAPDGGWDEGPGYWHYATEYTVFFLASLQSALGTDFGLSRYEGMDNAGQFRIDFEGPNGLCFNYADAGSRVGGTFEMYWLAHHYGRPLYAWFQRVNSRQPHPLDFVWYSKEGEDPAKSGVPLDAFYKGINVAFFRGAWNDRNALFVGFKGGDNKANHSHLDLGSFVLDGLGHRWAVDLGGDDYNLPGYFGDQRWTYFRLINSSHNTLVIDGQIQDPKAAAPITAFHTAPDWAFAQTDLSAAYKIKKARRGLGMLGRRYILARDEIEAEQPAEVLWGMLTPAQVALDGRNAALTIEGQTMHARILTPENARFDTVSANPPAPQRQQPDITKLVVRLPDKISTVDITVLISPDEWEKIPAAARRPLPLADWNAMKF